MNFSNLNSTKRFFERDNQAVILVYWFPHTGGDRCAPGRKFEKHIRKILPEDDYTITSKPWLDCTEVQFKNKLDATNVWMIL